MYDSEFHVVASPVGPKAVLALRTFSFRKELGRSRKRKGCRSAVKRQRVKRWFPSGSHGLGKRHLRQNF